MGENIFTSQTPASNNNSDGPLTLCTLFQPSVNGQINGIRLRVAAQGEGGRRVGLFRRDSEAAGALLASIDFVTALDDTWNYTAFATPVSVVAGQKYYAAAFLPKFYVATGGFFTGSSVTNGHLTAPADDTVTPVRNGRFHVGGADLTYPDDQFGGGCYFVDVDFTPTGATVTGSGSAALTTDASATGRARVHASGAAALTTTGLLTLGRDITLTVGPPERSWTTGAPERSWAARTPER